MLPSSAHGKLVLTFFIACANAFVRRASNTDLISLWCLLFNFRTEKHQALFFFVFFFTLVTKQTRSHESGVRVVF